LEAVESSNQHQITQVLDVIQKTIGFRVTRGLLERPVYRGFFAAGLTVLDPMEEFEGVAEPARLEVQSLVRQLGLVDEVDREDDAGSEIEPEMAAAKAAAKDVAADRADLSDKRTVTLVPGLPTRS
jgi:hypothetical protein